MTGKGDRWGRDSVGRSAPAFLAASTTALPHLPALHGERQRHRLRLLLFAARPANCWLFVLRPVPGGESAGCVCLQCLFCRLCACYSPCHAHCPHQRSCPRSVLCCFALVHVHVRQDQLPTVCKLQDCPVGSCNTGLQWRPVRRFIC